MHRKKYYRIIQVLTLLALVLIVVIQICGLHFIYLDSARKDLYLLTCLATTLISVLFVFTLHIVWYQLEHDVKKKAYFDVTGVYNKLACMEKLKELEQKGDSTGMGIAMFDLNNLKKVNDTYGHECGDEMILAFAHIMTKAVEKPCFLGRFGGDEFLVIAEQTSELQLRRIIKEAETLVESYNKRHRIPLSFASGYQISTRQDYYFVTELLDAADKQMYARKKEMKQKAASIL